MSLDLVRGLESDGRACPWLLQQSQPKPDKPPVLAGAALKVGSPLGWRRAVRSGTEVWACAGDTGERRHGRDNEEEGQEVEAEEAPAQVEATGAHVRGAPGSLRAPLRLEARGVRSVTRFRSPVVVRDTWQIAHKCMVRSGSQIQPCISRSEVGGRREGEQPASYSPVVTG
jgi:hypothetical protein